jgi:hypothetical protein
VKVETGELLSIGRFARLTGLTVKALRHYDAEGLLSDKASDSVSGHAALHVDSEKAQAKLGPSSSEKNGQSRDFAFVSIEWDGQSLDIVRGA